MNELDVGDAHPAIKLAPKRGSTVAPRQAGGAQRP